VTLLIVAQNARGRVISQTLSIGCSCGPLHLPIEWRCNATILVVEWIRRLEV